IVVGIRVVPHLETPRWNEGHRDSAEILELWRPVLVACHRPRTRRRRRRTRIWRTGTAKPDALVRDGRVTGVAGGSAEIIARWLQPSTPAQDAILGGCIRIVAPIIGCVRIGHIRAADPLPHISAHIQRPNPGSAGLNAANI